MPQPIQAEGRTDERPSFIGRTLSCLNRNVGMVIAHELEPYGIGPGQFPFIMRLYREDGVNQERIAQVMGVDKATVARNIQKLLDAGYIARERDENDARSYIVRLTRRGRSVEGAMKGVSRTVQDILLKGFSEKEAESARRMLERMVANLVDYTEGRE